MQTAAIRCMNCQKPLTTLAQIRGLSHCEAARCRNQHNQAELEKRWRRVGARAVQLAADLLPEGQPSPLLLWLRPASRTLVPVTEEDRNFLAMRWRKAWDEGISFDYGGEDTAVQIPDAAQALCSHCAGSCCAHGSTQAAFIGASLLRQWIDEHPGATVEDAIADHLALLPNQYIAGQCCFQSTTGCVLPRQRRSEVCNGYQCGALQTLGAATASAPDTAAAVLTRDGRHLESAVVFRHGMAQPLDSMPPADVQEHPEA